MQIKTIFFLTSSFPYPSGEQFIEDEIKYWAQIKSINIVLIPLKAAGQPRIIPDNIKVDLTLAKSNTIIEKIYSLFAAIFSIIFWRELIFIFPRKDFGLSLVYIALKNAGHVVRIEEKLKKIIQYYGFVEIAYCYWNGAQCYASILLKKKRLIGKVLSRAHRIDLYEESRLKHYMPLKRQFTEQMDLILAIADSGKQYLENRYGINSKKIVVSRLGVSMPEVFSKTSEELTLNILSISFCAEVKRIDKIIDAIAIAKNKINPDVKIKWTHIGGGQLYESLRIYAKEKLTSVGVMWEMVGSLSNMNVRKYFHDNTIDFFINASESEGIPVSIMEAMSYGVPAIAPDVGGISEIICNDSGHLLSENPGIDEIAAAIINMSERCRDQSFREASKKIIYEKYNAEFNYRSLISLVASPKPLLRPA